jgi:FlaA1/EpsC-like NDP-sugar epimerase
MNHVHSGVVTGVLRRSLLPGAARTFPRLLVQRSRRVLEASLDASGFVHWRRLPGAVMHVALIALASWIGFLLRFDGLIPPREWGVFVGALPMTLAVYAMFFIGFGLHRGFWRYTGLFDLARIVGATTASAFVLYLLVHAVFGVSAYPRSVFILTALLTVFLVCGLRLTARVVRELLPVRRGKRILIVGAGDAGEMIVRDLRRHRYEPVGFVDDDPRKAGRQIHGTRVLGNRSELAHIISETRPQEVLIAIPSASPGTLRDITTALRPHKLPIATLPRQQELTDGTVAVHQMRKLEIKDLLSRAPIGLDSTLLERLVEGRRVMVTGAGGSIGSELSRQVAALGPSLLILYERYENSLYAIANDLDEHGYGRMSLPVIGDVTDRPRLEGLMARHRPDLVFHAAAHKHVPLMELNPCEAVKNNVLGTRTVAGVAVRCGIKRFVLISTDKAVNPSSTMGATKRVAELILQDLARTGPTLFVTVRFGNVLGSNGSVLPRWLDQIRAGGPVTVTHEDIRRYFMLIPEAVQLVLHATTLARGGEVFVLDMGQQVKLVDMARHVIRLSGFLPDVEIPLVFTGLRPGEKLYEELVGEGERMESSGVDQILRVCPGAAPDELVLASQVQRLIDLAVRGETARVIATLRQIVPSFQKGGAADMTAVSRKRATRKRHAVSALVVKREAIPAALLPAPRGRLAQG